MEAKAKISLTAEQETLLIPLYAKSDPNNPIFYDPKAREILESVDYKFSELKVPSKTVILVCQRARKFDDMVREFLEAQPDGVVLHLGCGLDNRFRRVDNGQVQWYDLDMPPVADLRKKFFPNHERNSLISSSVLDLKWTGKVKAKDRLVLVAAEGLLMYLCEPDVKKLFIKLQGAFPGCRIIADAFSRLTARVAARHASLKYTGAKIGWGIDDPHEVENWSQGIELIDEWYFSQDPNLDRLGFGYRAAYRLAGMFMAANRAHRILYYQL